MGEVLKNLYRMHRNTCSSTELLGNVSQAGFDPEDYKYSERIRVVRDRDDHWALLAHSVWDFDRLLERNEALELAETPDPSLFENVG